jgi:hypothetical protein
MEFQAFDDFEFAGPKGRLAQVWDAAFPPRQAEGFER